MVWKGKRKLPGKGKRNRNKKSHSQEKEPSDPAR